MAGTLILPGHWYSICLFHIIRHVIPDCGILCRSALLLADRSGTTQSVDKMTYPKEKT
jgi:hypothetical protein